MALTSTLFTGLSGMDVNQTKLNVVGNNIANVNTVAFKSSRALFKPQFYVTDQGGSPPSSEFGGTNPSQRGLGVSVASIERDFSPGSIEPTGKATDIAIDGDGFFVVQGKEQRFTRDGSFVLNSANELVTSGGDFVQGFGVDEAGNILAGQLQSIAIPMGSLTMAKATSEVTFEGNLNANGVEATGASILNSQALTDVTGAPAAPTGLTELVELRVPTDLVTPLFAAGDVLTLQGKRGGRDLPELTFTIAATNTVDDLIGFFNKGLGIDTSIASPPGSPTPGASVGQIASDGATEGRLLITGNLGEENALSLAGTALTSTNANFSLAFAEGEDTAGILSDPVGESVFTSMIAYDSLGTPLSVNVTMVLETKADSGNTWRYFAYSGDDTDAEAFDPLATPDDGMLLGTGTLVFDNEGKLASTNSTTIEVDRADTGASTPLNIQMDFESMTSLTDENSLMTMKEQDGTPIGTLNTFSFGANGIITGSFDNGLTQTLGQIALATFGNPQGLVDKGSNMFTTGPNSGVPIITSPLTLGAGSVRGGALELSNVDLSTEFINLIIASTGFTASSRVISTSDELLTELLNTSR